MSEVPRLAHGASTTSLGGEAKGGRHDATAAKLVNRPTALDYGNYRFLIMDAPTDQNLPAYITVLKQRGVKCVVRACEPSYSATPLERDGIRVVELPWADGEPPPTAVVEQFLTVLDTEFGPPSGGKATTVESEEKDAPSGKACVAVHCVAGLGRAPCLVAISLVEAGMPPLEAIEYIRKRRRGAINSKQIHYIETYERRHAKGCGCVLL